MMENKDCEAFEMPGYLMKHHEYSCGCIFDSASTQEAFTTLYADCVCQVRCEKERSNYDALEKWKFITDLIVRLAREFELEPEWIGAGETEDR